MEQITRTPKQLGMLLRRRRRELGLTQEALASRIHLRQATVSALENSAADSRLATLFVPRHFLQSAEHAGVGEEIVHSIFGELRERGQEAIARTLDGLPARFPKQVSASIRAGFLCRLELIERT